VRLGACAGVAAAAAGALAAVTACGSAAVHPAAGSTSASSSSPASPSAAGSPAPSGTPSAAVLAPIPAATLHAVASGRRASITAVTSPGSALPNAAQSEAMAVRTALTQEPRGSQLLGLTLARVKGFGFGADMSQAEQVWLVSVNPFGGSYVSGNPACGRLSYVVEFIDPATGRWLMTASGKQPGLPPLPLLGPAPTLAQPSPTCGAQVPPVHQGTPAAS
jgi:hypothetical protein